MGTDRLDRLEDRETVHSRHSMVEKNGVERLLFEERQTIFPVCDGRYVEVFRFEEEQMRPERFDLIVNPEDSS